MSEAAWAFVKRHSQLRASPHKASTTNALFNLIMHIESRSWHNRYESVVQGQLPSPMTVCNCRFVSHRNNMQQKLYAHHFGSLPQAAHIDDSESPSSSTSSSDESSTFSTASTGSSESTDAGEVVRPSQGLHMHFKRSRKSRKGEQILYKPMKRSDLRNSFNGAARSKVLLEARKARRTLRTTFHKLRKRNEDVSAVLSKMAALENNVASAPAPRAPKVVPGKTSSAAPSPLNFVPKKVPAPWLAKKIVPPKKR